MATVITSTTIELSWTPPTTLVSIIISYEIDHRYRRLCESSFGSEESGISVTSTYNLTDITPYTECYFSLIGVYGAEIAYLTTSYTVTTLFAGKALFLYIVTALYIHTAPILPVSNTVYQEIFVTLNFREFHVSFPIRENLFREILGGVAHY